MKNFLVVACLTSLGFLHGCALFGTRTPVMLIPRMPDVAASYEGDSNGMVSAAIHLSDQHAFEHMETLEEGLGPLYNAQACSTCHHSPVTGGISQVLELRVGHLARDGSFQTPTIPVNDGAALIRGRSLVNARAVCPDATVSPTALHERVPASETLRTLRAPVNLLGDGLVEAVADETLRGIARQQCTTGGRICGLALSVPVLEAPGTTRVGRFGWKDQHASLLSFAGDASLNELGVTSSLFPRKVTTLCNTAARPNDQPPADGLEDIERFARFIRASRPPARDETLANTPAARRGEMLFTRIGCAICHVPTLVTMAPGTVLNGGRFVVPEALGNKSFHPYSDFLLHDIGTGDGIVTVTEEHYGRELAERWPYLPLQSYAVSGRRMRTAPLWGLRTHTLLMHDGASLSIEQAVKRHRGEASKVARRYRRLRRSDRQALEEFLGSL